jgi:PAS domain S-box-containing protein
MDSKNEIMINEHFFRSTFDNMIEGIQIHDFNWRYIYVNDALLNYSRYPREELLGYTIMEKYPGIEQTQLFSTLERCMKERISERITTEFVFPNGSVDFFELSIQPVPQGLFILSVNITDRKKNEEKIYTEKGDLEQKISERTAQLETHIRQLKESEEKFQKVFKASSSGMSITRLSDSTYLEVNDAFAELIGYSKEELIGSTSSKLGIVVNVNLREKVLAEIREYGFARHFEITVRHRSGRLIEVLSSTETILLNGEKYAINVLFDITERKRAEEELKIVNNELEAFSYSVSHDLRAPLRAVNGYAQILMEEYGERLDAEAKIIIENIKKNGSNMGLLIDKLLEFSRLGRKEIQKSEIDLNVLFRKVVLEINQSMMHQAKMNIPSLPVVEADYSLLYQVVLNLISNAIKYSSKKEQPIIDIVVEKNNKEIIFAISDNGVGFDMRYEDKLFGVFQRLHSTEEFEGTGVGLAIVQRIILKHGGRIWAKGELGRGATFYFSLPVVE